MTGDGKLITAKVGISAKDARDILQKHRIEKLPLVDENGMLKGLLTVKDIQKARDYPNASTDSKGRLLVGAAVGVGKDLEERIALLVKAGVDVVTISMWMSVLSGFYVWLRRPRTRLVGSFFAVGGSVLFILLTILLCR